MSYVGMGQFKVGGSANLRDGVNTFGSGRAPSVPVPSVPTASLPAPQWYVPGQSQFAVPEPTRAVRTQPTIDLSLVPKRQGPDMSWLKDARARASIGGPGYAAAMCARDGRIFDERLGKCRVKNAYERCADQGKNFSPRTGGCHDPNQPAALPTPVTSADALPGDALPGATQPAEKTEKKGPNVLLLVGIGVVAVGGVYLLTRR